MTHYIPGNLTKTPVRWDTMTQRTTISPDPITVVSTFTNDRVPLLDGTWVDMAGGPAHYIGTAFDRIGQHYSIVTGACVDVEVVRLPEGEAYRIPSLPPIPLPDRLTGPAAILSPINREVMPDAVPPVDGLLALDLQGFVRVPGRLTDSLDVNVDLGCLMQRAAVVKGAPAEVAALDERSRCFLRRTVLLETHGSRGVVLHTPAQTVSVAADRVHTTHTIGAGDTLLATFVVALLADGDPVEAARHAVSSTTAILRDRR